MRISNEGLWQDTVKIGSLDPEYFFLHSLCHGATTNIRTLRASEADIAIARASKVGL